MARIIEEAVVKISPDFTGFRQAFKRGLTQATSGLNTVKVKVELDTAVAKTRLEQLTKPRTSEVKVKLSGMTEARAALNSLRSRSAGRIRTGGGGGGGGTGGGGAGGGAGGLGSLGNATTGLKLATKFTALLGPLGDAFENILKLSSALATNIGRAGGAMGQLGGTAAEAGSSIAAMGPAAIALGAALLVVVGALGGVLGLLLALAGSLATAVIGLGAMTGAALTLAAAVGGGLYAAFSKVIPAIQDFIQYQDQLIKANATGNYDVATASLKQLRIEYERLSPAGQDLFKVIVGQVLPAFAAFRRTAETSFLPGITAGISGLVTTLGPTINNFLNAVGGRVSEFAQSFSEIFTSIGGQQQLQSMFAGLVQVLDVLKPAVIDFGRALLTIISAATPSFVQFSQFLAGLIEQFSSWIQRLNESGTLKGFFEEAGQAAQQWMSFIIEAFKTLWNLMAPLVPVGTAIVKVLTFMLKVFNAFASTVAGKLSIFAGFIAMMMLLAVIITPLIVLIVALVSPFLILGAAIAAVIYAVYQFVKAMRKVADILALVPGPLGDVARAFKAVPDSVDDALTGMVDSVTGNLKAVQDEWSNFKLPDLAFPDLKLPDVGELFANKDPLNTGKMADKAVDAYKTMVGASKDLNRAREREADVIRQTADAEQAAAKRIVDAQDQVKEAHLRVAEAQKTVVEARREAIKQIRDSYDSVEQGSIDLARAELKELETRGLDPRNLDRRQALLDLKNAREDLAQTKEDASKLQKGGVEGAPGVVAARKSLADARKDEKDAVYNLHQAEKDYQQTLIDGKRARRDAHDETVAATTAMNKAETQFKNTATAAGLTTGQVKLLAKAMDDLDEGKQITIKADSSEANQKLLETLAQMEAMRLMETNANYTEDTALAAARKKLGLPDLKPGDQALSLYGIPDWKSKLATRFRAHGGAIFGAGTATSDSIPAYLSNGEHVWTADEVAAAGGQSAMYRLRALVKKRKIQFAGGGAFTVTPNADIMTRYAQAALANYSNTLAGATATGYTFIPGGGSPGFPPYPPSAAAVHGHDQGIWRTILALAKAHGFRGGLGTVYEDRHTKSGSWSWHASGRAIDLMGYNQDALATYFAGMHPLELIHRTLKRDYAYSRGMNRGSFSNGLMEDHRNHIHIAFGKGGHVIADNGALLAPHSTTLVTNNTDRHEGVGFGMTRNEKIELAQLLAQAIQTRPAQLEMDGRVIAETSEGAVSDLFGGVY